MSFDNFTVISGRNQIVYNFDDDNYNAYNRLEVVRNGNVMDTTFYAKIEGSTLYVNTLERFEQGIPALTTVDLTSNGKFPLFASGYTGVLSWTDAVAFNLEISQYVA